MTKTYIDELVEEIQKLREENQRLRKWVEEFNILNTVQEKQELRELLEECYNILAEYQVENCEPTIEENIKLLTKIEEVL